MTKREKKFLIIIVILLFLLIGSTFAYFIAQTKDEANIDVNLISDKLDNLTYVVDKDINLFVNQFNLASGEDNVADTSTATVSFIANQTSKSAEAYYNIYFYIESNPYIYTTEDKKAEIILNIYDVNNNEVTSIEGLDYVSAENANGETINGFDITEKAGLYTVSLNTKITSNSSITATKQTWKVKLTFVNLTSNQVANEDKKLTARMILNDKVYKKITEVCQNGDNLANCIINFYNANETIASNIYHHDETLENGINDGSYRYAGPSNAVNNFVCFGSNVSPCPEDNLYRIIGVIDGKVKLIKYDYANSNLLGTNGDYQGTGTPDSTYKGSQSSIYRYFWNYKAASSESNVWSTSLLNKTNLNTNFINKMGSTWANKIATTTWKVGGGTIANISQSVPATAYQYEVGSSASTTTHDAKIGLMYASDYGFAADPSAWTTKLNSYSSNTSKNWLYLGSNDWTISRYSDNSTYAFVVSNAGYVSGNRAYNDHGVRPSFNLESTITYSSGIGTKSNPIIIN